MKIGILGTGMVGDAIGTKLVAMGLDVMMGSRTVSIDAPRLPVDRPLDEAVR